MERLQKIIAESGFTSRRKAEELIKAGKVYVNGEKVTDLETTISKMIWVMLQNHICSILKKEKMLFHYLQ